MVMVQRFSSAALCLTLAAITSNSASARLFETAGTPSEATPVATAGPPEAPKEIHPGATQHVGHNNEGLGSHPHQAGMHPAERPNWGKTHPDAAALAAHDPEWVASHPDEAEVYAADHPMWAEHHPMATQHVGHNNEGLGSHPHQAEMYAAEHPNLGKAHPDAADLAAHDREWVESHPHQAEVYAADHPIWAETHPGATQHVGHNNEGLGSHPHQAGMYAAEHPNLGKAHPDAADLAAHDPEWVASHPDEAEVYAADHPIWAERHPMATHHVGHNVTANEGTTGNHAGNHENSKLKRENNQSGGNQVQAATNANPYVDASKIEATSENTNKVTSAFLFFGGMFTGVVVGFIAHIIEDTRGKDKKERQATGDVKEPPNNAFIPNVELV